MTPTPHTQGEEREYEVTFDVFLMHHVIVKAKNKREAVKKAREDVCYGMGEEVTLHRIERV